MLINERLTALAGRGLERRPWHFAGGPQADSRQPEKRANIFLYSVSRCRHQDALQLPRDLSIHASNSPIAANSPPACGIDLLAPSMICGPAFPAH